MTTTKNPHDDIAIAIGEELRRRIFPDMFEDDLAKRNRLPLCVEEGTMVARGICCDLTDFAHVMRKVWTVDVGGRSCIARTTVKRMAGTVLADGRFKVRATIAWCVS